MRRSLIPLIYEIVAEEGPVDDSELLSKVRRKVPDVTQEELNDLLLRMEVEGLIIVTHASRDQKRVEALAPQEQAAGENEKGDAEQEN